MKLKISSTSKLSLSCSIQSLYKTQSKTAQKLEDAGIQTISDLVWLFPRSIFRLPSLSPFSEIKDNYYFRGRGKVISIQSRPNYKGFGKNRAPLFNINITVQDHYSDACVSLKWFNCYSSVHKKLEGLIEIEFLGIISSFNSEAQIVNPEFEQYQSTETIKHEQLKIVYPTINGIGPNKIKKLIEKIPIDLWNQFTENLPSGIITSNQMVSKSLALKTLHGIENEIKWSIKLLEKSRERLIYEEFFHEQLRILSRKQIRKNHKSIALSFSKLQKEIIHNTYPYPLTCDQSACMEDIISDFQSEHEMLRLVQGDVGCGKTTIAVLSCLLMIDQGYQTVIMCPTETLAVQHFNNLINLLPKRINFKLLLGATKSKERKDILESLKSGSIDLLVGTHSVFQEKVKFKNLGLSIIDEQHKFGVKQRSSLLEKGILKHCILMSATPIPRSLSLTQYGDLDISIIKEMPVGRKGSQTRIVTKETFGKFLNFIKTRLDMGEQVYVVVPAIEESEVQDINDLENTLKKFKAYYPNSRIGGLHGRLQSDEKNLILKKFKNHELDLIVSTSVIEVGIDILNATIMAIINPERFGLSSLHQMRGRVGRGNKAGFCFLIADEGLSNEIMHRLQVLENTNDGFLIAEEDLKNRGEGDLFGNDQSGVITQRKIANTIIDQDILYKVIQDLNNKKNELEIEKLTNNYAIDENVHSII